MLMINAVNRGVLTAFSAALNIILASMLRSSYESLLTVYV